MTIFYLNFLRALAIFFVVWLHANAHFLNYLASLNGFNQFLLIFFDSIGRFCVPMFFLISGALLLNKKENFLKFFQKRLKKIFFPFIFWCIFYFFWSQKSLDFNPKIFLSFFHLPYYHLWFIHATVIVYFLVPFLRQILKIKFKFQLILLLFFSFITLVYFYYFPDSKKISASFFYSIYFLWGYYLSRLKINRKKSLIMVFLLVLILIFQVVLFYFNFNHTGSIENYYREYFSFFVFCTSLIVFLLVKFYLSGFKFLNSKFTNAINYFSKISFSIYFLHIFILDFIFMKGFDALPLPFIIKLPFLVFLTLLICILIIFSFQKILGLVKKNKYSKIKKYF
jgi:surface polysaccharide O-acyltransferase-like enzyme